MGERSQTCPFLETTLVSNQETKPTCDNKQFSLALFVVPFLPDRLFAVALMSISTEIYTEATVPFVPISSFGCFTFGNIGSLPPKQVKDEDLKVRCSL